MLFPFTFSPWKVAVGSLSSVPLYFKTGVTTTVAFFLKYFSGKVPVIVASTLPALASNTGGSTLKYSVANWPIFFHDMKEAIKSAQLLIISAFHKNNCFNLVIRDC